nr:zinc finger, CCHC-type, retrotransposon Gag domain protein [Tanacetum cinerariifolium]
GIGSESVNVAALQMVEARELQLYMNIEKVDGDLETITTKFIDSLKISYIAPSIGGVESIVYQPTIMSYWICFFRDLRQSERAKYGIMDNLVRFSFVVADFEDLKDHVPTGFGGDIGMVDRRDYCFFQFHAFWTDAKPKLIRHESHEKSSCNKDNKVILWFEVDDNGCGLCVTVDGTVNVALLDEVLKAWLDKKPLWIRSSLMAYDVYTYKYLNGCWGDASNDRWVFMKPKALDKKAQEEWVVCVKKFDDIYEIWALDNPRGAKRIPSGLGGGGGDAIPHGIHVWIERYFSASEQQRYEREYGSICQLDRENSGEYMERFTRLASFVGAAAGDAQRQARHFKWGLKKWVLDRIVNTDYTNVTHVAAAARNIELLHESGNSNKRDRDGSPYRTRETICAIGIPKEIKEDEGDMNDGCDIIVKGVKRLRKILTPSIHALPNL